MSRYSGYLCLMNREISLLNCCLQSRTAACLDHIARTWIVKSNVSGFYVRRGLLMLHTHVYMKCFPLQISIVFVFSFFFLFFSSNKDCILRDMKHGSVILSYETVTIDCRYYVWLSNIRNYYTTIFSHDS